MSGNPSSPNELILPPGLNVLRANYPIRLPDPDEDWEPDYVITLTREDIEWSLNVSRQSEEEA